MQVNFKKIIAISLVATAFTACVRHRPVENKLDFDGNRWPKALFANGQEWLGTVTIVNNGSNQAFGMVGSQSETRIGHFEFTKDKLQFLTSDNFVNSQSHENRVINQWNITHSEYHQKASGGRVSNVVTENEDISWKDKAYFKVDWTTAAISEAITFPYEIDSNCWSRKTADVDTETVDIGDDHINFTVAVTYERNLDNWLCSTSQALSQDLNTNTVKYKYSFMPDFKSDYQPYVFAGENDPLMKKYGYFKTAVTTVDAYRRAKNTFLMNRWNLNKTHTFYFAKGFPEEFKWIYADPEIGVIARTNQLFSSQNLPIRFEIKDADDQHQFGDMRYSFFNFIDDADDDAPLGYGPSVAHPRTGEIISANTTIWTSGLKAYVKRIRDHVIQKSDRNAASSLMLKMSEWLGSAPDQWAAASTSFLDQSDAANAFRYAIPDYTYGRQGSAFANEGHTTQSTDDLLAQVAPSTARTKAFTETRSFEEKMKEIEQHSKAPSELQLFKRSQVRFLDGNTFSSLVDVAPDMSDAEIINDIMYRVAIHEFGHNLNLRHNFYGSVEAALDRTQKTPKRGFRIATASVMDYLDLKDELDQVQDWEPYDKAALLFAYSSGAIDAAKQTGRNHLFCTDENLSSNPLCNQFDSGATPTEVLKSMIMAYDDNFYRRNFRDDRAFWEPSGYESGVRNVMRNAKKFLNLHKNAYQADELQKSLAGLASLTTEGKDLFIKGIRTDMTASVKLAMAFYAAVIGQSNADRPFTEVFDSWSGSLKYKGIFADKVYAARFLLGPDGLAFNPNEGPYLTSFAELLNSDDTDLAQFTRQIFESVYTSVGDGYVGFTTMVRDYALMGTAYQKGSDLAYEATRFACYTAESLSKRFGVDAASFTEEKPLILVDDKIQITDPYFKSQSKVAIIQIDGRFYAAGADANFLAYALLTKNGVNQVDKADIRELYSTFYLFSEGRSAECQ